ncbi:hypothetical protein ACRAWF_23290 [Streptomyces sp. L7]
MTLEASMDGELVLRDGCTTEPVRDTDPVLYEVLRRMTFRARTAVERDPSLAHPAIREPGAWSAAPPPCGRCCTGSRIWWCAVWARTTRGGRCSRSSRRHVAPSSIRSG